MIFLHKALCGENPRQMCYGHSLLKKLMRRGALLHLMFVLAIILRCTAQITPTQNPPPTLNGLEQFIPAQMQNWKVPGLAIAVVQNGRTIYSHGFGLREVKDNLPVTSKTIFAIGSISKSFTSLSMGMLNDEGKFDWDKPVRNYLPDFQLYDPVASERITPRDLISHRVGMAGHDLLWYSSDFSREDLVRRLRFLQSDHDFRSGYHYNNMLVMSAGYLVGKLSGQSWEDVVRHRIFEPLEMNSSNFSVLDSQKSSDFAQPYRKDEHSGAVSEIPFHIMNAIGPAGSINSNVEDMARYAIFQLGKGKLGDRQLVSEANSNLNHTPQVPMPGGAPWKEIGPRSYAMGWVISSYRGHPLWWHNGGIDGFYALLTLLPEENLGVVILTNLLDDDPVPEVVAYHIYDHLLGLDTIDWAKRFQERDAKQKAAEDEENKKELSGRKPNTHPSHELKDYAGRYENPGYGVITIQPEGEGFSATFNRLTFPLHHYQYDVFEFPPNSTGAVDIGKLRFLTNMSGEIDGIAATFEPEAPEIIFTRAPENPSQQQEKK
jgi:CubicO group peptidase (beta-lactamase class C family)